MLQEPKTDFDFSDISLGPPNGLQGGSYFTKLLVKGEPLYLQIPKCTTKQGLVVTGKKKYCDLMFSRDAIDVISWFENIEKHVQQLMFDKKNIWFHEDLELSDIENAFTSPIRSYRSGNYHLVRCVIPKVISPETISCFNENEEPIDLEEMNGEDIEVIPLVELQGVRFSSKNFQIETSIRQIMIIKKKELFKKCLIRMKNPENNVDTEVENIDSPEETDNGLEETINIQQETGTTIAETDVVPKEHLLKEISDENQEERSNILDNNESITDKPCVSEETYKEELNDTDESNIHLEVETIPLEGSLEPIEVSLEDLTVDNKEDNLTLKNPNEVYYNMWKEARQKARFAKREALAAYLEAKKIKENYMLDGINSESEEEDDFENHFNLA